MSLISDFQQLAFERAAANILAREKARSHAAAKAEFAEWGENLEYGTEIRILRKLLWDRGACGRTLDWEVERYSDKPHPLADYLAEAPCPSGLVSRYLREVRGDYNHLLTLAGEDAP